MNIIWKGGRRHFWTSDAPRAMVDAMFCAFASIGLVLITSGAAEAQPAAKTPLTVEASIQVRRVLHLFADRHSEVQLSPDHKRYLMILTQADLKRDGNWIEFVSGGLTTLRDAIPRVAGRILTTSKRVSPFVDRPPAWLNDGESIAFLWDDGHRATSVMKLNLRTGSSTSLLRYTRDITNFSLSADNKTIIFSAPSDRFREVSERMLRAGFAVPDRAELIDLLNGSIAGDATYYPDVFVASTIGGVPRRIPLPATGIWFTPVFLQVGLHLAPNGRYAVITAPPRSVPEEWSSYDDAILVAATNTMRGAPGQPVSRVDQYWLVDTDTKGNGARPLWNAPKYIGQKGISWSPDSQFIAVGPTFLPMNRSMSAAGKEGGAVAIFNVGTDRYDELPIPSGFTPDRRASARWIGNDRVAVAAHRDGDVLGTMTWLSFEKQRDGQWLMSSHVQNDQQTVSVGVRLELRQDLNSPPRLYGVDVKTGQSQLLLDVAPELQKYRLGRVEFVHWAANDGRPWSGKLYYPVNYQDERRFPFVIKCGLYDSSNVFSVVGDDDNMTIGGSQAMAARDIGVLIVGKPDGGMPTGLTSTPREFQTTIAGYEGAIDHFADLGLADRNRIGILGVSRCGDQVAHFITQSNYSIGAAELADNLDDSYLQYSMFGAQVRDGIASDVGAEPIGDGLKVWFREAPGFNVDKIHAPVRLERDSGGLPSAIGSWEMFSRLRDLNRPVELYFIPDIEHGDHQLTNPAQLLASQGATVDWFDFWLNGHEDPHPGKADQYARWEKLCDLQVTNNQGSPAYCPRSTAHATSVSTP